MKGNQQTRKRGADPTMPRLLGDRLCLDFANSVESPHGNPEEFLHDYMDVIRWGRHVGIIDEIVMERLRQIARDRPEDAQAVFHRAIVLRAAITRAFVAIAAQGVPDDADLASIQGEYLLALHHAQLTANAHGFEWSWTDNDALDRPLWDVARSAIDVLTTDDLTRVKQCPGADDCGWLFYDTSKNASRRWCSMEGCGSRVKMRHQYARKQAADL